MDHIRILTTGRGIASRTVTNDDLSKVVDTSDDWIYPRTGIHSRQICGEGESVYTLAEEAVGKALEKGKTRFGIREEDIGCVVGATISGATATPSLSCLVQQALHLPEQIPVLDVNAACSGFVYALEVARGLLCANGKRYGLVFGAEALSRLLDWQDRTTCILFADGAGAALIERAPEKEVPYGSFLAARGGTEIVCGGVNTEDPHIRMDGKAVFRFAVTVIPVAAEGALSLAGVPADAISHVICHQANARILGHVMRKSTIPREKFFQNISTAGNTSAASIPSALAQMEEEGLLKEGDLLLLVGFGSGLTYAGMVIGYGRKEAEDEKAE